MTHAKTHKQLRKKQNDTQTNLNRSMKIDSKKCLSQAQSVLSHQVALGWKTGVCSVLCKVCNHVFMHIVFCLCSYVCVIACDWVCVYKTAGVLIVASHLPHISTLRSHTCLLSYVHCGFSTSPALPSQPQIRAVYLTTVASSLSNKNTLSLRLCLLSSRVSCFFSQP